MENSTISIFEFTTTILPNITKHVFSNVTFSWYDYILFCVMLFLSVLIGIYFGCFGSKQSTANEYLLGDKEMKVIPIAISLIASHSSGITLLALPADVYLYGAAYWIGMFSMGILCAITIYVYLPVFFNLQIRSTYEYLERRFDSRTRKCGSLLFALSLFLYLPIVIYIPALSFSAATGINVHYITPIVCGVCIFYTTIGGLKAVVWTDTLQFTVTVGSMTAVFILGLNASGGFRAVWNKALEGGRLDVFDFDIDPTKRETFWAIVIGLTTHWLAQNSVSQGCIQKYLSVPTHSDAKKSVIYYSVGMCIVKTASVLTGLIMFKRYSNCDPFTTKQVMKNDQLLPYYTMDVAGNVPGLPGLFMAGVFCAALSTLSANLNCLAGTIYEDFFMKFLAKRNYHKTDGYVLKIIVVVIGIISTIMVYIVEHLGGLLPLAIGIGGVAHGPLLGMITLGVLFTTANGKGTFYGALISVFVMSIILGGNNYYKYQGFKYTPKPLSVDGCKFDFNVTLFNNTVSSSIPEPPFVFRISFYYITLMGTLITIISGLIISYITSRKDDPPVDKILLSPVIYRFLKEEKFQPSQNKLYYNIDKALKLVNSNDRK